MASSVHEILEERRLRSSGVQHEIEPGRRAPPLIGRDAGAQEDLPVDRHAEARRNRGARQDSAEAAPRIRDRQGILIMRVGSGGNECDPARVVIDPDHPVPEHVITEQTEDAMVGHSSDDVGVEDRDRTDLIRCEIADYEPRKRTEREVHGPRRQRVEDAESNRELRVEGEEASSGVDGHPAGGVEARRSHGRRLAALGSEWGPDQPRANEDDSLDVFERECVGSGRP